MIVEKGRLGEGDEARLNSDGGSCRTRKRGHRRFLRELLDPLGGPPEQTVGFRGLGSAERSNWGRVAEYLGTGGGGQAFGKKTRKQSASRSAGGKRELAP